MVHSFSTVFSVGPSFPTVSVRILQGIVLHREMISILLYCSVTSTFVLLRLSLRSASFRFHRFRVPTILFVLGTILISFNLLGTRFFLSLDNTSNSFFSCSCLFPRVTTLMSSSHAGVLYSSVRSFFSEKIVRMSASRKTFFLNL